MAWQVIEAFVQGKWDDPARCEDVLVITDHFAAVLDGATTRSGALIGGVSPGRFAALSGEKAIATLSPDTTAAEAVAHLSQHLRLSLNEAGQDPESEAKGGHRVIYSFVMVSRHRREVWRISDCAYA